MSAQPVTTLETIEHLDFEPETPCEHPRHENPPHKADLLIRTTRSCCSPTTTAVRAICFDTWRSVGTSGLHCIKCGAYPSRDECWQILEVLS